MHEDIKKTAIACASKGSHFDALWHELLERMLNHWQADIQMDLWDATKVMLHCAGYYNDSDWRVTNNYDLWYQYENDASNIKSNYRVFPVINSCLPLFCQERAFKITIAVFETINYWCYYTNPVRITLTEENLIQTLKYGNIHIKWDSYKY